MHVVRLPDASGLAKQIGDLQWMLPASNRLGKAVPSRSDAEQLLLEHGSQQAALWGANYYPGKGPEGCIEYTSLINIRPAQGNRSMLIADPSVRERVREITFALIGQGEPLP